MAETEKPVLSPKQVLEKIRKGIPIEDVSVPEKLQLNLIASTRHVKGTKMVETSIDSPVIFKNCLLKVFLAGECAYHEPIVLERCVIDQAAFDSCYVKSGVIMSHCEFLNDIFLFLWSGDNLADKPVQIIDCTFHGFVDMYDASFYGPVTISGCRFVKGTNLLGNRGGAPGVFFAVPPIIERNEGKLDLDGNISDWMGNYLPNMPMSFLIPKQRKKFLWF